MYLTEKEFEKSKSLLKRAESCKLSKDILNGGYLDHLNELATSNKWSTFDETISILEKNSDTWAYLIYPISLLANELESMGKVEDSKKYIPKMLSYYEYAKKQKIDIPLDALDAIAKLKIVTFEENIKKFKSIALKFPEKEYNLKLKLKFSTLAKLATEAESITEVGSGSGTLKVYRLIIDAYDSLNLEVTSFTPPEKSESYLVSFKKGMQNIAAPLDKQSKEFKSIALLKIEKENILSSENAWFLTAGNNDSFTPVFFNPEGGALMDKAGVK
jgi:hypothetical protein